VFDWLIQRLIPLTVECTSDSSSCTSCSV